MIRYRGYAQLIGMSIVRTPLDGLDSAILSLSQRKNLSGVVLTIIWLPTMLSEKAVIVEKNQTELKQTNKNDLEFWDQKPQDLNHGSVTY